MATIDLKEHRGSRACGRPAPAAKAIACDTTSFMPGRPHKRFADVLIAAATVALIVYGSLYPFDFHDNWDPGVPFRALLATWRTPAGWADRVANVLFYLPFGFFAARCLRLASVTRVLVVLAAGIVLSTSMELSQFYVIDRFPSMADVYANATGALLGAAAGCLASGKWENRILRRLADCKFPLLLLACWLGSRLFPYVPVIDLHKYWRALRALSAVPALAPADVYRNAVEWLAVAAIVQQLPGILSKIFFVWILAAGVLFARILIGEILLSRAEVVGLSIGVLVWTLGLNRLPGRAFVLAALVGGVFLAQAIFPAGANGNAGSFEWLPFVTLMEGTVSTAVPYFFERVFLCGALLWLLQDAGMAWNRSVLTAVLFVCSVCVIRASTGKTGDTTDCAILLMVAAGMKLLDRPLPQDVSHEELFVSETPPT